MTPHPPDTARAVPALIAGAGLPGVIYIPPHVLLLALIVLLSAGAVYLLWPPLLLLAVPALIGSVALHAFVDSLNED